MGESIAAVHQCPEYPPHIHIHQTRKKTKKKRIDKKKKEKENPITKCTYQHDRGNLRLLSLIYGLKTSRNSFFYFFFFYRERASKEVFFLLLLLLFFLSVIDF